MFALVDIHDEVVIVVTLDGRFSAKGGWFGCLG
jgi:hypothetical protein